MTTTHCYHCGLLNPSKPFKVEISGESKDFCCTGCQSAAETIISSGLGEYYRFHQPDKQPVDTELTDKQWQALLIYDRDDVQSEFVTITEDRKHTAILLIEGISCSACTWLIEKRLSQLPGVVRSTVNASTHRLSLQWTNEVNLSDIFKALMFIGYRATPYLPDKEEQVRLRTQRQFILRLGVAGIGMMQAMMNAVALYSGDIAQTHEQWLWWTSLFLTLPVILISAWPFFTAAWHSIRGRQLSMDISVSLAILSAFFASLFATISGHGEVYYESVNMFTFFLVLSRFLEFRARTLSSTQGNQLAGVLPPTCTVIGDNTTEISVRDLKEGQIIQLLPGETSPIDGVIESGESSFDESSFTGEFKEILKRKGDTVFAGTINQSQAIRIKVSKVGAGNSFNYLQQLVERASSEKPRIAELADKGSRQFIWTTLIISFLIGLAWLWYDPSRAFWVVISVLVVTCPCALSLATPTALAQATANLKNQGFVITRGYVLERLAELKAIAFDKTGTLTEGRFALNELKRTEYADQLDLSDQQIKNICAALERYSEHSIASAFQQTQSNNSTEFEIWAVENKASKGVTGQSKLGQWKLGSANFTHQTETTFSGGITRLFLTCDDNLVTTILLNDRLRTTVKPLLALLKKYNISSHVLTGDPNPIAELQLREAGLTGDFKSHYSPENKLDWIKGQEPGSIAAVGDGINDAPFLAGGSVSIAMLEATDLTKTQADVLLLTNNLQVIGQAINVAKRTKAIIRQNLAWALVYNAVALPIAALGWVSPWQAAIGMSVSSLLVVGNAVRLRK